MESTRTNAGYRWEMTEVSAPLVCSFFDLPEPGPGEALVRVAGCGVCHTDLGFLFDGVKPRAGLPLALGHEISGFVTRAGPGFEHLAGRAVIVPAVTPCGECEACRAGFGTICPKQKMPGNDVPGGFADYVVVPANGLCLVDDQPDLEDGGEVGRSGCDLARLAVVADAVTTPYQAIRRARVGEGDFALVIGLGGVGGFAVQIARALGAVVVGFDIDARKLEPMSEYGLAKGFDPSQSEPRALRKEVQSFAKEHGLPGQRWKIFECSGTAAGQRLAWSLLGPGAYLSVIGYTMERSELRLSNLMAFDAKAVGNWGCLPELYPEALDLVLQGKIAIAPFVETHPMSEIQTVLDDLHGGRIRRRPVLLP